MPASFASCRNGRIAGRASARTTPIAVATSGLREPVREPRDEHDEPERDEVERVAVVEPVVRVRRAVEGRDDEEPDGVGREEERGEGGCAFGAGPTVAEQVPEHDRRDRQRYHGEVDLEVGEVVDEPLRHLERVVAAPELPVRSERLAR